MVSRCKRLLAVSMLAVFVLAGSMLAISMLAVLGAADASAQYTLENAFPNLKLVDPVDLQSPRDGSDRLFVVELDGRIVVFPNDPTVSTPDVFLDIRDRVERPGDGGLFGVAFHPDFENNGYFYLNYTAADPLRKVVSRFSVDPLNPNRSDPLSELVLLEIPLEENGHNGGQIAFGPDEYLYVATGDGNPFTADSSGNGQDPSTLTGTMIRIDVDGVSIDKNYGVPPDNPFVGMEPEYREEVYAYGFRNPWRFSFDSESGALWLADVGAAAWEEIDLVESGGNYGWNVVEGTHCFDPPTDCETDGLVMPVWEYGHEVGRSVTGGYVYRGGAVPDLHGKYVYGDFVMGQIWALTLDEEGGVTNEEILDSDYHIVSFGLDAAEELYVVVIEDSLFRIRPSPTAADEELPIPELSMRVFPNPSSRKTTIEYDLPHAAGIELDVYTLLGVRLRTLASGFEQAGTGSASWDGRDETGRMVPAGTYFVRLRVGDRVVATRPTVRIR